MRALHSPVIEGRDHYLHSTHFEPLILFERECLIGNSAVMKAERLLLRMRGSLDRMAEVVACLSQVDVHDGLDCRIVTRGRRLDNHVDMSKSHEPRRARNMNASHGKVRKPMARPNIPVSLLAAAPTRKTRKTQGLFPENSGL